MHSTWHQNKNQLWFVSATIFLAAGFCTSSYGEGVTQELWMHMQGGYIFYFNDSFPNFSPPDSMLPIVKVCATGRWRFFENENFMTYSMVGGSLDKESAVCTEISPNSKVKSLRHLAGPDTGSKTISLYAGIEWTGKEILVLEQNLKNINSQISSFVATSTSNWTLFEGENLDGRSICFKNRRSGFHFFWVNDLQKEFNLTTVGSVSEGCTE